MSSTEGDDKERLAREFFAGNLLALSGGAGHYFATGPDPQLESYFVRRPRTRWSTADFESQAVDAPEKLAAALAAFWQQSGDPALAALAPGFAALASRVYDVDTAAEGVTPFMYVMF